MTQYSSKKHYKRYNVYTWNAQNYYKYFQRSTDDDMQIYYHNIDDV